MHSSSQQEKEEDLSSSPFAPLRAKGLLAKNTAPCLELKTQLLGAEFCAALSQAFAEKAAAPRRGVATVTRSEERRDPKRKQQRQQQQLRQRLAQRCATKALTIPLLKDLSAHYGCHAWNRGSAKPLGPSFRSRQNCAIGAHEGRAWQVWRRAAMSRRWCRRCGSFLKHGVTTALVAAAGASSTTTTTTTTEGTSSPHPVGRTQKGRKPATAAKVARKERAAPAAAARKRVCLRCFTAGMKKCIRYQRRCEERRTEKNEVVLIRAANRLRENTIPDLAKVANAVKTKSLFDPMLLKYTTIALAGQTAVKRPRRRKRRLSKAKQAKRERRMGKKKAAVVSATTTPEEQRRVVKQVLIKAVPKGPLARGKPLQVRSSAPPPIPTRQPTGTPTPATSSTPLSFTALPAAAAKAAAAGAMPVTAPPPPPASSREEAKTSHEKEQPPAVRKQSSEAHNSAAAAAKTAAAAAAPTMEERSTATTRRTTTVAPTLAKPPPKAMPPPPAQGKRPPAGPPKKTLATGQAKTPANAAAKKKVMDVMSKLGF